MSNNFVKDNEIIYRRISAIRKEKLYEKRPDGTIKIYSSAFSDRSYRTSVDRAELCHHNPHYTMGDDTGVVAILVVKEVRGIKDIVRNNEKGESTQQFTVDVEASPLSGNPAHAEIIGKPNFIDKDKRGAYLRLCRHLARLAEQQYVVISASEGSVNEYV